MWGRGKREKGGERWRGELLPFGRQFWNMQSVKKHALFPDSRKPGMYKEQDAEKGRRISTHSLIKLNIQGVFKADS